MGFSFRTFTGNGVWNPGRYRMNISDIKRKTSGTEADEFDLMVIYRCTEGPMKGKTIPDTMYRKSFGFRLLPFLTALGLDTNREFSTVDALMDYGIKAAIGREVYVDLQNREYNGNKYNDIKTWAAVPTSVSTTADVLAEFNIKEEDVQTAIDIESIEGASDAEVSAKGKIEKAKDDAPFDAGFPEVSIDDSFFK